jgi:hypothetical protein
VVEEVATVIRMSQGGITGQIQVGVRRIVMPGQDESGDVWLATDSSSGWLIAAVDGIGHGVEAASAARTALEQIAKHPDDELVSLVNRCHEKLKGTRGAVMSLASIDREQRSLSWVGVGNVGGVLLRGRPENGNDRETLLLRPGLLGHNVPPRLQPATFSLQHGDTLVFATDGIRADFVETLFPSDPPQQIADGVGSRYARGTDDGLVVVVRYLR